jgi:iron complex outermembrane receptor protein
LVTDYIGSERVPPSEIRPQTKGVLGVKKFVNFDKVWLTGFEVSWTSPSDKLWHIRADMAYTYGVNPEAIGYKLENGQIVDEVTIKNDALPEIPSLELHVLLDYDLFNKKLTPSVFWRLVAPQNHISKSYGEQKSDFFQTLDVKLKYVFNRYLSVWGGVNNLFDVYYFEHLNRNIIGSSGPLYEPGRNFFVNLMFRF